MKISYLSPEERELLRTIRSEYFSSEVYKKYGKMWEKMTVWKTIDKLKELGWKEPVQYELEGMDEYERNKR